MTVAADQVGRVAAVARPTTLKASRIGIGVAILLIAFLIGVLVGPVELPAASVLKELFGRLPLVRADSGLTEQEAAILWQIRIPRVVLGGLVGSMLAISGAAYQGVFRNPLADPYLLGAAAGAGLGATLAIAYGAPLAIGGVGVLPLAAFAGAIFGVALAYAVGRSAGGRGAAALILAGVAVASFLTAIQTYVQQRESETLREIYAWILGQLTTVGWKEVFLMLPYALVSGAVIVASRRLLEVMSVGDDEAGTLGVRAARVRLVVVVAASLGTAAAVAVSGLIGFVGIIVPHTVRLIAGTSYRLVIPLSLVYGAVFMILADLIARTAMAPAELPIGVVTAFFGAPFFAVVLRTSRRVA